jgi:hypothetical protein
LQNIPSILSRNTAGLAPTKLASGEVSFDTHFSLELIKEKQAELPGKL